MVLGWALRVFRRRMRAPCSYVCSSFLVAAMRGVTDCHGCGRVRSCIDGQGNVHALSFADPLEDTFGSPTVVHDITSIGSSLSRDEITFFVEFAEAIAAPSDLLSINSVVGFLDIDTDQDTGTGAISNQTTFSPSGPSGLGVEYFLDLSSEEFAPGLVDVVETVSMTHGRYGTDHLREHVFFDRCAACLVGRRRRSGELWRGHGRLCRRERRSDQRGPATGLQCARTGRGSALHVLPPQPRFFISSCGGSSPSHTRRLRVVRRHHSLAHRVRVAQCLGPDDGRT